MEGNQDIPNNQTSPGADISDAKQHTPSETMKTQTETLAQTHPEPELTDTPTEIPNPKKESPKVLIIAIFLILLIVIFAGAYIYLQNQKQSKNPQIKEDVETENQLSQSPTPDPTTDWETYKSPAFQVKYPNNLISGGDESTLNIAKWGPTQTEGTELFDGYSITFQIKELADTTPQEYADTLISETESVGISEITKEPSAITINNYQGVTYTEEGLGTYKHIILGSNNSTSLMLISVLVSDPGNLGFEETVDQILSTFKFITEN